MAFDVNVIPAEARTKEQIALHIERYKRTQDTIQVYNPTDEDYVVWNDRKVTNERWTIPNKGKDIGVGKGNNNVPRFVAERYLKKMGQRLIQEISKADWEEKKLAYPLEQRGMYEERLAIKVNDRKQWDKLTPILWKGVVERYQGDAWMDEEEKKDIKPGLTPSEAALERLELLDKELGVGEPEAGIEDRKQQLADQLV